MTEKNLVLYDPKWMVWRVLREDSAETDAQTPSASPHKSDVVARTLGNVVTALFRGYKGVYRVLPDGVERVTHDYQHLGTEGSLGFNVPPWVEKNRGESCY